ncbi:hypothetical protein ACT7DI_03035 [Bacillus paranthracis]
MKKLIQDASKVEGQVHIVSRKDGDAENEKDNSLLQKFDRSSRKFD